MKYAIIALALLMLVNNNSYAQDTTSQYRYSIKAYNMLSLSRAAGVSSTFSNYLISFVHPSVALQVRNKKGNYHELELSDLSVNQTTTQTRSSSPLPYISSGQRVTATSVMLRYEYIVNLVKGNKRLIPSIGFAGSPYYVRYNVQPYTTVSFPEQNTYAGVKGFVIPRFSYHINPRVFLDLNIPICISDNYIAHNNVNDPSLTTAQQRYTTANLDLLPQYFSARIGAGIKF